ncbi:MAG: hypothetical protein SVQ76_01085 [Candidatus Nanohaloarchaea archaeon]|nr:hypothetical protein [Candidatus Nanohaloarchaea archaeon]
MKKITVLILLFILFPLMASAQGRMNTTRDTVRVGLGERVSSTLLLHNPLNKPDEFVIGVGTVMESGEASVQIAGGERTSDRIRVHIGAGKSRVLKVYYTGSMCTSASCIGDATFLGRSVETDRRFAENVRIVVRRDTEVYGSPGLETLQLIFMVLAATVSFALLRERD